MTHTLAFALACFIGASAPTIQARPDFSGSWVRDGAKSRALAETAADTGAAGARAGGGRSGGTMSVGGTGAPQSQTLVVRQSAREISAVFTSAPRTTTAVYALDGSERANVNGNITTRMRARWEGRSLVLEGKQTATVNGEAREVTLKETWSLEGGDLRVVTVRQYPSGPASAFAVYTRRPS